MPTGTPSQLTNMFSNNPVCECGRPRTPLHCPHCGSRNLRGLQSMNYYDERRVVVSYGRTCCRCGHRFNEADNCAAPLMVGKPPSPRTLERMRANDRAERRDVENEMSATQRLGIKQAPGIDADGVSWTPEQLRVWFPDIHKRADAAIELLTGRTTVKKLRAKHGIREDAVPDSSPDAEAKAAALFAPQALPDEDKS